MSEEHRVVFITPTWAGDLDHFRVMRASFEQSSFARFDHYVVVQDEDIALFEEFRGRSGLILLSTKDVLPEVVEYHRKRARRLSKRLGRHSTRICGSLKRIFSWPIWPSYTGWHTQQICKLKLASELTCDTAVILDSDVIITKTAVIEDFLSTSGPVCFANWLKRTETKGKVKNWIDESEYLVNIKPDTDYVNVYFDTPFVFNQLLLCEALSSLETRFGKDWWNVFLNRPPRRWSEFGFYKAFLIKKQPLVSTDWRDPSFCRYLYDTKDSKAVVNTVSDMMHDPQIHYVTIHSQANGREFQDPNEYLKPILALFYRDH
ncbi:hypothetical protein ELY33_13705 [Vreelandella andesensis]|uniref:Glycosyl transferase n=1 Tax=Vreelandella andesensis TaxID=447567 RepID=A0A3S0W5D5_9GAMM|nr:DUF6492 family protein [Halomonas andesensis]RUR28668.1 hypothetical protein ELY33_13705 [Halomonas andesensis]